MRILRIADVQDNRTGGMSRTMYCTGDELQAQGHEVDYLFSQQIPVASRGKTRRFAVPLKLPSLIRAMSAAGRKYDVIEVHEPIGAPFCLLRRLGAGLPPVVLFSYGLEERGYRAEMAYRRLKNLPMPVVRRISPLTQILQSAYGVRHSDHTICSNAQDVAYLRAVDVPARRLTQHHSGADPQFLEAGAKYSRERQKGSGLLFMGSWLLRKGILDLVPATTLVLRENPQLRLTVAGCSVDEEVVRSRFDEAVRPQVRVIPRLTGDAALIDIYREHSILILPSYFEGQPLVMMEAATLGLAVVTTNVCGMIDFIEDGVNGYTVPVGDVEALADRLRRLVDDPEMTAKLGDAAWRKVQNFTWSAATTRIIAAYEAAIANRPVSLPSA